MKITMAECVYCELQKFREALIYYDDDIVIAASPFPMTDNEIIIMPKNHHTIFEQVPAQVAAKMGLFSKYLSILLFQKLECHGTNIIAENGTAAGQLIPHFAISIVPRFEGDNIDLSWSPTQPPQNSIKSSADTIASGIKAALESPLPSSGPEENRERGEENMQSDAANDTGDSPSSGSDDNTDGKTSETDGTAERANGPPKHDYYSDKLRRLP